jgi:[1-hydroxy-2-(trimethylamino)ethyl]phosphonate dioxygenase
MTEIVDRIVAVMEGPEADRHYGEGVSERAHALQAAALARGEGAPPALIAAALLHDIGHLLHGLDEDIADRGIDGKHEAVGAAFLAKHFVEDVVGPVALHVDAKRYLVAAEPGYAAKLSAASVQSMELQGGVMSDAEAKAFAAKKHFAGALRVRRWDEEAKIVGLNVPPVSSYRDVLEASLRRA